MRHRWLGLVIALVAGAVFAAPAYAQPQQGAGPYARMAFLRPHDGDTVDFEAGYIRHLHFHRQSRDTWVWYGYSIWASPRQRSFMYASFGHTAASLSNPVSPAEDERDNVANVTPHAQFTENGVYEFLPRLSRGNGVPTPAARLEFVTVRVKLGAESAFQSALAGRQSALQGETLWFRMIAGGELTRYVRLRSRRSVGEILDARADAALPAEAESLIEQAMVEIMTFRPTMSYGLEGGVQ